MEKVKLILSLAVITASIIGCSSSKPLAREVKASINKDFVITKSVSGIENFTGKSTDQTYHDRVVESLTSGMTGKGITVTNDSPEYKITIEEVSIVETSILETINDTLAKNNGSVFKLSSVKVIVSGYVTAATGVGKSYPFSESKEKNESTTKNRGAMQHYKGENMHSDEYREKKLSDYEVLKMIGSCAYNGGKRAAKNIIKDVGTL